MGREGVSCIDGEAGRGGSSDGGCGEGFAAAAALSFLGAAFFGIGFTLGGMVAYSMSSLAGVSSVESMSLVESMSSSASLVSSLSSSSKKKTA